MASLENIPEELLSRIAVHLGPSGSETTWGYSDLLRFCLVSRKFARVGQEALFSYPLLTTHPRGYLLRWEPMKRMPLLLRIILEQPHLANHVQKLRVTIAWRHIKHAATCSGHADDSAVTEFSCYRGAIESLCLEYLRKVPYYNLQWRKNIESGEESALLGVLLTAIPNLKHLVLHVESRDGVETFPDTGRSPPLEMVHLFGTSAVQPMMVPGLRRLRSLDITGPPERYFVNIPTLTSLRITLPHSWEEMERDFPDAESVSYENDSDEDDNADIRPEHVRLPADVNNPNITTLEVEINPLVFMAHNNKLYTSADYFFELVNSMPSLEHLYIELSPNEDLLNGDDDKITITNYDYDNIASALQSETLQSLVIDLSNIGSGAFLGLELLTVKPMRSLAHLKKLRRVVAPEEAFLSWGSYPESRTLMSACELPPSIETIEVIDATRAFSLWQKELSQNPSAFPNLQTIRNWFDRRQATHDDGSGDISLHTWRTAYVEDMRRDWGMRILLGLDDDTEFVNEMQNAGIDWLNILPQERQPWRLQQHSGEIYLCAADTEEIWYE